MKRPLWRRPAFWALLSVLILMLWVMQPFWIAYTLVSPFALRGLPERMKQVKPGMTEDQMWQTLAIPRGAFISKDGSGPRSDYHWGSRLPYGYSLYWVMDDTHSPSLFKHGTASRTHWP